MRPAAESRLRSYLAGTHARIDLDRYTRNIQILKDVAGPDRAFMAVVKGNAYGHGAIVCGQAALAAGADVLAVARVREALLLRRAGIDGPILILGGPNPEFVDEAIEAGIALTAGSRTALAHIAEAGKRVSRRAIVHLKLDTGLHRFGVRPEHAVEVARVAQQNPWVDLEGIYAHFSSADEPDPVPTLAEMNAAEESITAIRQAGIDVRYFHLPNSAATISGLTGSSTLVRSGIATYGLQPSDAVQLPPGIEPVLSLHSRLTRVFEILPGEGVSYGLTYRATDREVVATVPIGYGDGLPRSLSNRGWFTVKGERAPIRGRVCMDQTIVGLPVDAVEGDEVVIIGHQANDMPADMIATLDNTIVYEVVARLSLRVPRIYYRNGEPAFWEDDILGESFLAT